MTDVIRKGGTWYSRKEEPSFADLLTTLRRVSLEEKISTVCSNQESLKTWLARINELFSRAG